MLDCSCNEQLNIDQMLKKHPCITLIKRPLCKKKKSETTENYDPSSLLLVALADPSNALTKFQPALIHAISGLCNTVGYICFCQRHFDTVHLIIMRPFKIA